MEPLLEGVKVVELTEWGFVPSCAAILADWGADVVHLEHPQRGDSMRGLMTGSSEGIDYMFEQFNRGKRSAGLDVGQEEGRALFLRLIERADVFLTSFLEPARRRLRITYDDLAPVNPRLVYGRGHGQGQRGPDAEKGGYDGISYWARGGIAHVLSTQAGGWVKQRAAFGDVTAGMFLAGGIAAALFRRSVTGRGGLVDVSLFNTAIWVLSPDIIAAHLMQNPEGQTVGLSFQNPLALPYQASDGRYVNLMLLQGDRYWPNLCRALGREDLLEIERYRDMQGRSDNAEELTNLLAQIFATKPAKYWAERLTAEECIWAPVQNPLEVVSDPQTVANGYMPQHPRLPQMRFAASPVQYNNGMVEVKSGAPELGQHTEEVMLELGLSWEEIGRLKEQGVIT